MFSRPLGYDTPFEGAVEEALLDEVWFVEFFECADVFAECDGERFDADRSAGVVFDDDA